MSMEIQQYNYDDAEARRFAETIILQLGDAFNIRIVWDSDTSALAGLFALAGGLLGGFAGGRMGAALGAGIGGATGLGVSTVISLRELWSQYKDKLQEIFFLVINFLRRLDPLDYVHAAQILMTSYNNKKELVLNILCFIGQKLGTEVLSSLTED